MGLAEGRPFESIMILGSWARRTNPTHLHDLFSKRLAIVSERHVTRLMLRDQLWYLLRDFDMYARW